MSHDTKVTQSPHRIEQVYREQAPRLWRAVLAYSGSREIADDAVAEAFAMAIAAGERVREPGGWVWRVAFRVATAEVKRRSRERSLVPPASQTYDLPDPTDDVVAALATLSPSQRLAVLLHDYADRPTDEVAHILGTSRATVYVHLSQGRRRLRKLLEDHDA